MSTITRFATLIRLAAVLVILVALRAPDAQAEDNAQTATPATCDSTLVVLLVIAEHDYQYLSEMDALPNLDYGQYARVIEFLIARTNTRELTDEQRADAAAMQAVINMMMTMTTSTMLAQDFSMEINAVGGEMTTLQPGSIPDENAVCTRLRGDVEKFLTAHLVAEMQMMAFDN